MNDIEIGNRYKELRESVKFTREQMAAYLGVDENYVKECEEGNRLYSFIELEKFSNLVGCSIEDVESEKEIEKSLISCLSEEQRNDEELVNAVASVNRIIQNLTQMEELLQKNNKE